MQATDFTIQFAQDDAVLRYTFCDSTSKVKIINVFGNYAYLELPNAGNWEFINVNNDRVEARWSEASMRRGVTIIQNFDITSHKEGVAMCQHQFVEMGFMHSKMVCKFCDLEKK